MGASQRHWCCLVLPLLREQQLNWSRALQLACNVTKGSVTGWSQVSLDFTANVACSHMCTMLDRSWLLYCGAVGGAVDALPVALSH